MKNILNATASQDLKGKIEYFKNLIPHKEIEGKKILDIGCGYGAFVQYSLNCKAQEAAGIEVTEKDLKTAKNSILDPNATLKIGSALEIPFPDSYFDIVVSFEVLEHIPVNTENQMFSEISRVLKKGGILYLSTPYNSFFSKYTDPAFYLIGHRHYSEQQLEEFTNNNNLKILTSRITGTIWELISLYNLYISKWIFRRNRIFEDFFVKKTLEDYKNNVSGFMGIQIKAQKI